MKARNPIVIHYVYDMKRAKVFYQSVFMVEASFESPGWTQLNFGSIELALHILSPNSREPEAPLPHAGLNLEVDNIEELQADIERLGGELIELREPQGVFRFASPHSRTAKAMGSNFASRDLKLKETEWLTFAP